MTARCRFPFAQSMLSGSCVARLCMQQSPIDPQNAALAVAAVRHFLSTTIFKLICGWYLIDWSKQPSAIMLHSKSACLA